MTKHRRIMLMKYAPNDTVLVWWDADHAGGAESTVNMSVWCSEK